MKSSTQNGLLKGHNQQIQQRKFINYSKRMQLLKDFFMVKELVEYFVKTLVTHPDKVHVTVENQQGKQIINVRVAPEDRGRVIGKDGKTIRSIRQSIDAVFPAEHLVNIDLFNDSHP